jgi:hypothetical protein
MKDSGQGLGGQPVRDGFCDLIIDKFYAARAVFGVEKV